MNNQSHDIRDRIAPILNMVRRNNKCFTNVYLFSIKKRIKKIFLMARNLLIISIINLITKINKKNL